MRCRRASNVCGRLGVAVCCGTRALFSPVRDQGVGFSSDVFSCDGPIASRLSLCHHSDRESEVGRSYVSSRLCLFFFGHLPVQTNIFAYGLACIQNLIRGLTCCRVFSSFLWVHNLEIFICPRMPRGASRLWRLQRGLWGCLAQLSPIARIVRVCSLPHNHPSPPFATIPQSSTYWILTYAWILV